MPVLARNEIIKWPSCTLRVTGSIGNADNSRGLVIDSDRLYNSSLRSFNLSAAKSDKLLHQLHDHLQRLYKVYRVLLDCGNKSHR